MQKASFIDVLERMQGILRVQADALCRAADQLEGGLGIEGAQEYCELQLGIAHEGNQQMQREISNLIEALQDALAFALQRRETRPSDTAVR